ncbi:MAG: IS21 family transposase [Bacteroidetes bacterium]|nr:IS21 family transposase [Bacteroidota bacterium]
MANQNIDMSKLRQILKHYMHHQGTRTIRDLTGVSRNTVKKYIAQFKALKTPWDELNKLNDKALEALFIEEPIVPDPPERQKALYSFFPAAEKKLKYPGMTLQKLWEEYSANHIDGFQSTGFYKHYKLWKGRSHPSMHMVHKAGQKMFVDFAGKTLQVVDNQTGEVKSVEVFVAILGASQLTFVTAVESQDMEDFIRCCELALHYFGGAPVAIVPDNLKSAVTKSSRYEPRINENFEAFAEHYGMAVLPARVYKPKDKSLVEGAVKIAYNRIYTNLHGREFTSIVDLNQAILLLLENHNTTPFHGRTYSRKEQFDEMEKQTLQPLHPMRFEMRQTTIVTVMKNGHVCLHSDKHYYSVPYDLIGKKVKLFYSKSKIEIYYKYDLKASHERIKSPHNYTTDRAHLATFNLHIADWNPERFLTEAGKIHPDVKSYVNQVLRKKAHPEQAYKSCQGILSFAKRVGHDRLIRACQRAHLYGLYHYRAIENILLRNLDQTEIEDEPTQMPTHDNIRGEEYYT